MKKRFRKLESEIPFGLRRIGILLDSGVDFYKTLRIISKEDGEFPKFIKKIIDKIDDGLTVEESLRSTNDEYQSEEITRVISQVIVAYKSGEKGERIRRIGNELLSKQEYKIREYSSKSSVYGLIFLVLSVIVPTLLTVIYNVGEFALGIGLTKLEFQIILLIVLPAINLLLLFISRIQKPESVYERKEQEDLIYFAILIIASIFPIFLGFIGLVFLSLIGAVIIYKKYKKERIIEEVEEKLPDMLLHLSGMEGLSFERMLREISKSGYGELSKEFKKSYNQFRSNIELEKVIKDLKGRTNSILFSKTTLLMKYVVESGNFEIFAEIAEDILRYFEIKRNKANLMSMQKYTLLLGAVIIPIILHITMDMTETLGKMLSNGSSNGLQDTIPTYLVLYSLLSGHHILEIESRKSKAMLYSLIMLVSGLGLYFIMLTM